MLLIAQEWIYVDNILQSWGLSTWRGIPFFLCLERTSVHCTMDSNQRYCENSTREIRLRERETDHIAQKPNRLPAKVAYGHRVQYTISSGEWDSHTYNDERCTHTVHEAKDLLITWLILRKNSPRWSFLSEFLSRRSDYYAELVGQRKVLSSISLLVWVHVAISEKGENSVTK